MIIEVVSDKDRVNTKGFYTHFCCNNYEDRILPNGYKYKRCRICHSEFLVS